MKSERISFFWGVPRASAHVACALGMLIAIGDMAGHRAALGQATPPASAGENQAGAEMAGGGVMTTLTRLDAAPGTTVLLPVVPAGSRLDAMLGPPNDWVPQREPGVTIAGRPLAAGLYRLDGTQREPERAAHEGGVPEGGAPEGGAGATAFGGTWLPVAMEWTSTPWLRVAAGRAKAPAGGAGAGGEGRGEANGAVGGAAGVTFWVLAVTLPDQPIARNLEIDGKRLAIRWLPKPPEKTDVARMPLLEASVEARRALGDFLRSEARDPFRRWRCALVADRFSAHALWGDKPALLPFADPILEAAAAHAELRARASIDAARRIDPDLSAKLLSALTAVVKMPSGELLPAWPADDAETLGLLSGLLDTGRTADQKRADLDVWLEKATRAIAWVVSDDAATIAGPEAGPDGSRSEQHVARIAIANMTDRDVICSCAPEGQAATNAQTLLAHRATVLRTPVDPSGSGVAARLVARAGTAGFPLSVVAVVPAAAPPGIDLGPLLPDWTMTTWLGARAPRADVRTAATARLFAAALGDEGEDATSRRWKVAVEARTPPNAPAGATDTIQIWCGREGEDDAVITLESTGKASIEMGLGAQNLQASFATTDRGWQASVELPAWLTEGEAIVRFGVVRVDGRGLRSSWPRPMMPGQTAPGRIAIDLTKWTRLAEP